MTTPMIIVSTTMPSYVQQYCCPEPCHETIPLHRIVPVVGRDLNDDRRRTVRTICDGCGRAW